MSEVDADLGPELLARLDGFIGPLMSELETRKERRLAKEYVLGLLGPTERKTVEPMVRALRATERAPARERRMREMLAEGNWNHRSLTLLSTEKLIAKTPGWSAYTLDDTALLKQGEHSVGVAHQYAGCVGGLANCQSVVTAGIASEHVSALMAAQLYLPKSWCGPEAEKRRQHCHVPQYVTHRTKLELALDIVRDVASWALPKRPWLCDSGYGESLDFRQALIDLGETYVVGVTMKLGVWEPGTTFVLPPRAPNQGRPPKRLVPEQDRAPKTVAQLATSLPPSSWVNVTWRHGSRGEQRGRFCAVRVRPSRGFDGARPFVLQPEQWLLMHWPASAPKPTKAWLSNLPADEDITALISLARLRWRIERDHEETKGLLGLDQYEGRTWAGLHHHLALVILADQFLALERWASVEVDDPPTPPASIPPCAHAPRSAPRIDVSARRATA